MVSKEGEKIEEWRKSAIQQKTICTMPLCRTTTTKMFCQYPSHRIEINQKSNSRENVFRPLFFNAHVRKHAILTPSWQVPPALLTFKRHLPVTKADVFADVSYLYTKKPRYTDLYTNLLGWRIDGDDEMREATCART